ncbi:TPA: hypothetical protein DEG21_00710 [Patescibacteria group bacterium]|nr:hypothetical protein [Candidatus Gracilibacteria bacterium]
MKSKISQILEKIDSLKRDLYGEYERLARQYDFFVKNKKVVFADKVKIFHKSKKVNLFKYIFTADVKNILTAPFIYVMIVP